MKRYACGLVHVTFRHDCRPMKLERGTTMADLHRLFTLDELKDLDQKDLEILRTTIAYVLRTDDEIRVILRRRVRDVYNRLK
jgi:hypothetical protein